MESQDRPRLYEQDRPSRHSMLVAMVIGMAGLLLPPYIRGLAPESGLEATLICSRQMLSYYLLPAIGFWLVLREGGLDLGVWIAFSLGALATAAAVQAALPPWLALPAGLLAGAVVGAASAAVTRWARLPVFAASLLVAVAAMVALDLATTQKTLEAPNDAFSGLLLSADKLVRAIKGPDAEEMAKQTAPLAVTRAFLVALTYGAVMLVMILRLRRSLPRAAPADVGRTKAARALVASGALAGWGGALSLLDLGRAAVPAHVIGDLRVPAAALLAGAWYLQSSQRKLLTGVLLPPAMLLVTAFLPAWDLACWGYALQLLLLMSLTLLVQLGSYRWFADRRRGGSLLAAALGMVATWALCLGAYQDLDIYRAAHRIAVVCGLVGAALLGWPLLRARRR